jgi:signal transduction histidine kinase
MDLFNDFGPSGAGDTSALALERARRLLDCWQRALGHELPNQMLGIAGLARLLEETQSERLDADGRDCLERLIEAAQRGGRLLDALAELGTLCREVGADEGVSLVEVAQEAEAEANLLGKEAVIEYDFQTDLPNLAVSRRALHQVLAHLLRNAIEAAQPSRLLRIRVGGRTCAEGVEFWVADNGCGLRLARPERLFEPFANRRGEDSWGLGLFLVREIVAAWHGTLRVQSEAGEGTTFTVLVRNRQ